MNPKAKWFFGILGTLVLGALGSGLWNGVFSPVFSALGRISMSLLTLGYASARDGVYEQASKGLSEEPSLMVLFIITMAFPTAAILSYFNVTFNSRQKAKSARMKEFMEKSPEERTEILEKMELGSVKLKREIFWLTIAALFVGAFLNAQILFTAYSHKVIRNFNRELTIITPDIPEQQRQIYQSRFASMKTRAEFISLIDEINKTAEAHGKPKSTFIPW